MGFQTGILNFTLFTNLRSPPSLLSVSRRDDVVCRRRTSGTVSRPLVGHVPCPRFLPDASRPRHAAPPPCTHDEDGRQAESCRAPLLYLTCALGLLLPLDLAQQMFLTSLSTPFQSSSRIGLASAGPTSAVSHGRRRPRPPRRPAPPPSPSPNQVPQHDHRLPANLPNPAAPPLRRQ